MYFVAFVCVNICAGKLGFKGICGVVISYGVRWFVKDAEIFPVHLMFRCAYSSLSNKRGGGNYCP